MNMSTQEPFARRTNRSGFRALVIFIITALTGCASQVPVQPIASGTPIEVVTPQASIRMPDADSAAMVGKGAAAGAGLGASGGAAGGLLASLGCGPLLPLCVPIFMGGGAAVGLVVGGAAGTIGGAMMALPADKAAELNDIIAASIVESDISRRLRDEFETQTANRWILSDQQEDITVTLQLTSINIEQFNDDLVTLHMNSRMLVRYGPDRKDTADKMHFQHQSGKRHIDYWLENDGENFRSELEIAYANNASQMVRTLTYGSGNNQRSEWYPVNGPEPVAELSHAELTDPGQNSLPAVEN